MRNHVERVLGILRKRFPILRVPTFYAIENQVKIPAATSIIHNIIKMHGGDEEWLDNQPEPVIDPAYFVDLPNDDDDNQQANNHQENLVQGNLLRDQIAFQMWNDFE